MPWPACLPSSRSRMANSFSTSSICCEPVDSALPWLWMTGPDDGFATAAAAGLFEAAALSVQNSFAGNSVQRQLLPTSNSHDKPCSQREQSGSNFAMSAKNRFCTAYRCCISRSSQWLTISRTIMPWPLLRLDTISISQRIHAAGIPVLTSKSRSKICINCLRAAFSEPS